MKTIISLSGRDRYAVEEYRGNYVVVNTANGGVAENTGSFSDRRSAQDCADRLNGKSGGNSKNEKAVILKGITKAKAYLKEAGLALEHESPAFFKALDDAHAVLTKDAKSFK